MGGGYDNSFVVCGYKYNDMHETQIVNSSSSLQSSQKSRYILISHKNCVEYILSHPGEKLILIGTSCFIHGILNLISEFGLERENYFLLGLFCDRTMTMNVVKYFGNNELYFRTKDNGGWPGGVRLVEDDGRIIDLPASERMKVKDFFQPERCLYCLDKLNMFADISIGDNYTGKFSDKSGSSSIIIRTQKGLEVWEKLQGRFEVHESNPEEIIKSQRLNERINNYFFAQIKEAEIGRVINAGIKYSGSQNLQREYRRRLKLIRLGESYCEKPSRMINYLRLQRVKGLIKRLLRKCLVN